MLSKRSTVASRRHKRIVTLERTRLLLKVILLLCLLLLLSVMEHAVLCAHAAVGVVNGGRHALGSSDGWDGAWLMAGEALGGLYTRMLGARGSGSSSITSPVWMVGAKEILMALTRRHGIRIAITLSGGRWVAISMGSLCIAQSHVAKQILLLRLLVSVAGVSSIAKVAVASTSDSRVLRHASSMH